LLSLTIQIKTTRENGWFALRLKASATGRGPTALPTLALHRART